VLPLPDSKASPINTPRFTKFIRSPVRDATHMLDGFLYHESDLRIEEHYTDTAGLTDHVFALCHLLGFAFAPRIADSPTRAFTFQVKPVNGRHCDRSSAQRLCSSSSPRSNSPRPRLATSIKHGTVIPSLILRKPSTYPRQNGLALALREMGRIERTIFTLK
jgi:TnpA family transposase